MVVAHYWQLTIGWLIFYYSWASGHKTMNMGIWESGVSLKRNSENVPWLCWIDGCSLLLTFCIAKTEILAICPIKFPLHLKMASNVFKGHRGETIIQWKNSQKFLFSLGRQPLQFMRQSQGVLKRNCVIANNSFFLAVNFPGHTYCEHVWVSSTTQYLQSNLFLFSYNI